MSLYHRLVCSALSIVGTAGLVAMSDPLSATVRLIDHQVSAGTRAVAMASVTDRTMGVGRNG